MNLDELDRYFWLCRQRVPGRLTQIIPSAVPREALRFLRTEYRLPPTLKIVLGYDVLQEPGHVATVGAGSYRIMIHEMFRGWDKIEHAILAHELAHIAGYQWLPRLPIVLENERLTDILTIWLGGGLLSSALIQKDYYRTAEGEAIRQEFLGYLSPEEREYALGKFEYLRGRAGFSETVRQRHLGLEPRGTLCPRCHQPWDKQCSNCALERKIESRWWGGKKITLFP